MASIILLPPLTLDEVWSGNAAVWSVPSIRSFWEMCFFVFDGMGGEEAGETAAFLCARP